MSLQLQDQDEGSSSPSEFLLSEGLVPVVSISDFGGNSPLGIGILLYRWTLPQINLWEQESLESLVLSFYCQAQLKQASLAHHYKLWLIIDFIL